jgi:RNA polymerase sigma-70 factor (family 1)
VQANAFYTDDELLCRIAKDEEKAFNLLFERYRNRLYSYLVKTTKSKETSEEATLDVFLKIWNARQMLHEVANFEAFLFRVVHNKAIDYIRKAKSSRLVQQEIWTDLEKLAATDTADQKILNADTEAAINIAIKKLPTQRKEAFRLSREEYLNYDEIAERMEISRNTVRNHVSAALQFIRAHLDNGPEIATLIVLTSRIY